MTLSLQQLRTPFTRTEALELVLQILQDLGFDTTGWQDGRIQKTLVTMVATVVSDFSELPKALVEFCFNRLASGDALNEYSKARFDNEKTPAVRTRGAVLLTSRATVAYTISPGQLIVATDDGVEFRNIDDGTGWPKILAAGGTLPLPVEARVAGITGNVPASAIKRLVTALAGVTVSASGNPWYSIAGADEESDEHLQRRNETKWATLTVEFVAESYEHIALSNGAVKVVLDDQNPRGPGTIDVYVAGATDLLGNVDVAALQAAYAARVFHTDSAWPPDPTSRVWVLHAFKFFLDLAVNIYHDGTRSNADMAAAAQQALRDFVVRTPIGGYTFTPGPSNVIPLGDLYEVFETIEGVKSVSFPDVNANIPVGSLQLVVEGDWQFFPQIVATRS